MNKIFVDSGAWYAYMDQNDSDHAHVLTFLKDFTGELITSNYVFDETITLAQSHLGHNKATQIGRIIREARDISIVWVTPADEELAWQLFLKRRDKTYSLTDCTSFVLMRRLKIGHCLSTDEHFRQEGFSVVI